MIKKILTIAAATAFIITLSGCDQSGSMSKQNMGVLAGGVAGGALGGALFHGDGKIAGVIGGAILGGLAGGAIGHQMDRQDEINMQNAIISTPLHSKASWTNERRHAAYTVTPVREGYNHETHRYCREYQTVVTVNGEKQKAFGKACREPDGSWKIIS